MAQTDSLAYTPILIWFISSFILLYIIIYTLFLYSIFVIYRCRVDYYDLLLDNTHILTYIINKINRNVGLISVKYLFRTYNAYILILFVWSYTVFVSMINNLNESNYIIYYSSSLSEYKSTKYWI